jgi:hypothetical protein
VAWKLVEKVLEKAECLTKEQLIVLLVIAHHTNHGKYQEFLEGKGPRPGALLSIRRMRVHQTLSLQGVMDAIKLLKVAGVVDEIEGAPNRSSWYFVVTEKIADARLRKKSNRKQPQPKRCGGVLLDRTPINNGGVLPDRTQPVASPTGSCSTEVVERCSIEAPTRCSMEAPSAVLCDRSELVHQNGTPEREERTEVPPPAPPSSVPVPQPYVLPATRADNKPTAAADASADVVALEGEREYRAIAFEALSQAIKEGRRTSDRIKGLMKYLCARRTPPLLCTEAIANRHVKSAQEEHDAVEKKSRAARRENMRLRATSRRSRATTQRPAWNRRQR